MAKQKTIAEMFALLRANWPRHPFNEHTLIVYEKCLSDIDDDLLEAATLDCIARATFFPPVAEIRRAAFDLLSQREQLPTALEAWGEVKRNTGRPKRDRVWSHELVRKAIGCVGGVGEFGASPTDQESSWRARFVQAYDELVQRQRTTREMLPQVRALVAAHESAKQIEEG